MAPNRFQKFSRHATPHLSVVRHQWTAKERRSTIITVYHTEPTVRNHYANSDAEIPTLASLFPDVPYTAADAIEARSHGLKPADIAAMNVTPIRPIGRRVTRSNANNQAAPAPAQPANQAETVDPATAVPDATPDAPTGDGVPYKHWPALPWPIEPDLPHVGAGILPLGLQDAFMATKPHMSEEEDESQWHGAKFLGSGSSGAVGLWCKVDEYGNVVDRMVVKDNTAWPQYAWRDPKNWRDGLPTELAIGRRIESRRAVEPEAFENIIKYRGHRLLMWQRRYRLYTDYAPGGCLADAISLYDKKWKDIKSDLVPSQDFIPEAFIWYTIKALATACLALETGTLGDEEVEGWKPIVHLDMQSPNILLDVQNKKRKAPADEEADPHSAGPSKKPNVAESKTKDEGKEITIKLADFGLSFFDQDFDHCPVLDDNPHEHILPAGVNTTRYAPEHNFYTPTSPDRLDEKTNIWGIGRIAWTLIVNRLESHGPVRENGALDDDTGDALALSKAQRENMQLEDRYDDEVLVGSQEWPASSRYSEELKLVVRGCLRYAKEMRPSPRELLDSVERVLEGGEGWVEGMRDVAGMELKLEDNGGMEVGEPLVVLRPGM